MNELDRADNNHKYGILAIIIFTCVLITCGAYLLSDGVYGLRDDGEHSMQVIDLNSHLEGGSRFSPTRMGWDITLKLDNGMNFHTTTPEYKTFQRFEENKNWRGTAWK